MTTERWVVATGPDQGVRLYWAGTIDRVLVDRNDQQWDVAEATVYADKADAVAAAFILGGDLLIIEHWLVPKFVRWAHLA